MGGRGSSGGGQGGKHGENWAASAKMPELKGSEKQIKWANDIRDTALRNADLVVKNAKNLSASTSFNIPSVEAAEFARNVSVKELQSVNSASKIIDKGTVFTRIQRNDAPPESVLCNFLWLCTRRMRLEYNKSSAAL